MAPCCQQSQTKLIHSIGSSHRHLGQIPFRVQGNITRPNPAAGPQLLMRFTYKLDLYNFVVVQKVYEIRIQATSLNIFAVLQTTLDCQCDCV